MLSLRFIKNKEQRVIKLTRAITLHTHTNSHTKIGCSRRNRWTRCVEIKQTCIGCVNHIQECGRESWNWMISEGGRGEREQSKRERERALPGRAVRRWKWIFTRLLLWIVCVCGGACYITRMCVFRQVMGAMNKGVGRSRSKIDSKQLANILAKWWSFDWVTYLFTRDWWNHIYDAWQHAQSYPNFTCFTST
jgi:hypothetical protein